MVTFESATMDIIQKEYTTYSDLNVCTKFSFVTLVAAECRCKYDS
ncbi:MAG: hypothetical protein BWY45_01050 [Euryarchaeota archaeon ADurb.Bin294]|nr:MAG: hypothetical protein BWY45_01050 [Euryarchaeota archaeon ADurb.Bin294]